MSMPLLNRAEQLAQEIGIDRLRKLGRTSAVTPVKKKPSPPRPRIFRSPVDVALEEIAQLECEVEVLRQLAARKAELLRLRETLKASPIFADAAMIKIAGTVLTNTEFTLDDLRSHGRTAEICAVRFACIHTLRAAGYSKSRIARFLNRDHSSIIHALNREVIS